MRGRVVIGTGLVVGLLIGLALLVWPTAGEVAPIEPVRLSPIERRVRVPIPVVAAPDRLAASEPIGSDAGERVAAVATDLARQCGLSPRVVCDGADCVALAEAPDLDAASGWAQMLVTHPRFVASTALRDLGVPAGALPCGDAIAALTQSTGSSGVGLVERADGTEVWCAGAPAVCDRASTELGLGASGFGDPEGRRLRFDRSR